MRLLPIQILGIAVLFLAMAKAQNNPAPGIAKENDHYPYAVKYFDFNSQNQPLQMAYMYPKTSLFNGKTVLLFHGKNFNAAYWRKTIQALLEKGWRVLAPDQIGFGKSTKPDCYQYSFQQLAFNTRQLLDHLGIHKVIVLGHSMGGMLATRFALLYPDMVTQLILENPIGLEDYKRKVPYQPVSYWHQRELKKSFTSVKRYMQKNYFDGKWDKHYNEWVRWATAFKKSPDIEKIAQNNALTYDMIFTQPVCYEFQYLKMPTVLIIGTRDRTAPGKNLVDKKTAASMGQYAKLAEITKKQIPNCILVTLKNTGHLPHIENFKLFEKKLFQYLK